MTTLMRNGRDRRSGKPVKGHAILERALLVGTRSADHIRASGHSGRIATGQASTRKQAGYMAAPERFAKRQIHLAPRAPSIHGPSRHFAATQHSVALGGKADIDSRSRSATIRPWVSISAKWRIGAARLQSKKRLPTARPSGKYSKMPTI